MVNHQTSQYELLNLFCYLSRLGVFQYVIDILQFTVSLDHPVLKCIEADLQNVSNFPEQHFHGNNLQKKTRELKLQQKHVFFV